MHANFQGSSIKTEDFFRSDRVTVWPRDRVTEWVSQIRVSRAGFSFGSQLKKEHISSTKF